MAKWVASKIVDSKPLKDKRVDDKLSDRGLAWQDPPSSDLHCPYPKANRLDGSRASFIDLYF